MDDQKALKYAQEYQTGMWIEGDRAMVAETIKQLLVMVQRGSTDDEDREQDVVEKGWVSEIMSRSRVVTEGDLHRVELHAVQSHTVLRTEFGPGAEGCLQTVSELVALGVQRASKNRPSHADVSGSRAIVRRIKEGGIVDLVLAKKGQYDVEPMIALTMDAATAMEIKHQFDDLFAPAPTMKYQDFVDWDDACCPSTPLPWKACPSGSADSQHRQVCVIRNADPGGLYANLSIVNPELPCSRSEDPKRDADYIVMACNMAPRMHDQLLQAYARLRIFEWRGTGFKRGEDGSVWRVYDCCPFCDVVRPGPHEPHCWFAVGPNQETAK